MKIQWHKASERTITFITQLNTDEKAPDTEKGSRGGKRSGFHHEYFTTPKRPATAAMFDKFPPTPPVKFSYCNEIFRIKGKYLQKPLDKVMK